MTTAADFIVRSSRIVTPEGIFDGGILVRGGIVEAILDAGEIPSSGVEIFDAGARAVLPGLVDSHVHVNEPGRTEWEGFESATRAAAAGGVTTIVDMPLNSVPVTTTADALRVKVKSAQGKLWVDCGFWGGIVPGNAGEIGPMAALGARGFKAFLVPSGIDEFPQAREADLRAAMPLLARAGLPLLAHAELDLHETFTAAAAGDPRRYAGYLASRPKIMENTAIALLAGLCRETGCAVHIVHLSSAEALPILERARSEKLPFTAETCPHYLTFAAEEIADGRTEFKCAPPIREKENRERLWRALKDGLISCVVSDHSPCVPALKKMESGDFLAAWGGIASLQFGLPAVWTGARQRGLALTDLARWMCEGPAALAGFKNKGKIAKGRAADLTIFDPDGEFTVEGGGILHRHKVTPYLGRALKGKVDTVFLRGKKIFDRGNFTAPPAGSALCAAED